MKNKDIIFRIFLTLFGLSFHFLTTIEIFGATLRLGVSDLILPIFILWLIYYHFTEYRGPEIRLPRKVIIACIAITIWITFSLIWGGYNHGKIIPWALINKWIGWIILLCYGVAGYWVYIYEESDKASLAIKSFLMGGIIGAAYSFQRFIFRPQINIGNPEDQYHRMAGFFDNPNAFGIAMAVSTVLFIACGIGNSLFSKRFQLLILVLFLSSVVLSASRSAYLGLSLGIIFLLFTKTLKIKIFVLSALISGLVTLSAMHGPDYIRSLNKAPGNQQASWSYLQDYAENHDDVGLDQRIAISKKAIESWSNYPFIGIGLGSFKESQAKNSEYGHQLIHTSALWILTEQGLIGLFLFIFLIYINLKILWKAQKLNPEKTVLTGLIAMCCVFIAASIGTEVLYQRYFWYILGLGLAIANLPQKQTTH